MKTCWLEKNICYTGKELSSLWIAEHAGTSDDAIVSFVGPADVPIEHMVDLEDVAASRPIWSANMLHLLIRHNNCPLNLAVTRGRLLVTIVADLLREHKVNVLRRGDDLFDGEKKLSVSIAAPSPTSSCIHFAINIESGGTPVPTKGLADYNIDPKTFGLALMKRYDVELQSLHHATTKVRSIC